MRPVANMGSDSHGKRSAETQAEIREKTLQMIGACGRKRTARKILHDRMNGYSRKMILRVCPCVCDCVVYAPRRRKSIRFLVPAGTRQTEKFTIRPQSAACPASYVVIAWIPLAGRAVNFGFENWRAYNWCAVNMRCWKLGVSAGANLGVGNLDVSRRDIS